MSRQPRLHLVAIRDMPEKSFPLSKLKKAELVALVEAALSRLSAEDRAELLAAFTPAKKSKPARAKRSSPLPSSFREEVQTFVDKSLAGAYWEITGRKNEHGFYETPQATKTWCRKAEQLCASALQLARDGEDEAVAFGLELLLDMMGKSEGDREIVWAEEWGVSWNVNADFKRLLRAFFEALSRISSPEDFARRSAAIARQWTWKGHDAEKLLRRCAKGEHRVALEQVLKKSE